MLNKSNEVGAIAIDLSKAFNTLNQNNILCNSKPYGFDKKALIFVCYIQIETIEQK